MEKLESHYRAILEASGEDPERKGLEQTPARAAAAYTYLTSGYQTDIPALVNDALFPTANDDIVIVKNIEFYSLCEHHLLPFFGHCQIGYIPRGRIIGLSKLPRIVNAFARRLQVQENLSRQIADCVLEHTNALGVGVIMEAKHMCMLMRGVQKQNTTMRTSCMLGMFRSNATTRAEFLRLLD